MGLKSSGLQPSTGLQKLWLLLGGHADLCPSLLVTLGVRPVRTRAGPLAALSPTPPPGKEVRGQGEEVTAIDGTDGKGFTKEATSEKDSRGGGVGPVVTLDRVTAGERFWVGGLAGELEELQGRKHGQSGMDRAGHRVGGCPVAVKTRAVLGSGDTHRGLWA